MDVLLRFSRLIDRISGRAGVLCEYLILIVCFISAGNAFMRYAISYSSNAYLEIQWYLFGVIVLLGGSYALLRNEHVRVDVVYSALSDRGRIFIDIIGIILFLIPMAFTMTFLSWPFFVRSFLSGEVSMNAGGLILWPIKFVLPLGFFLLLLQALSELIKRFAALQGLVKLETKYEKPLQ
jgi:TRAP-type mannitol/chloroaromatic compound transport system permease small subunit